MPKSIFLLSGQVIHWNILPGADRKNVYLEHWGNHSIKKFMNSMKSEFNSFGKEIDWSLLDNGMAVQESAELKSSTMPWWPKMRKNGKMLTSSLERVTRRKWVLQKERS